MDRNKNQIKLCMWKRKWSEKHWGKQKVKGTARSDIISEVAEKLS